jgi:hypothetical protein
VLFGREVDALARLGVDDDRRLALAGDGDEGPPVLDLDVDVDGDVVFGCLGHTV